MGSVSGASVAIGARPSQQHHNMVMRATVVVFTIVLIIAGVFASEIAKEQNGELAEDDILQLSHSLQETQSNLNDLEDLNVHVKRDAVAYQKKKIKKRRKQKKKGKRKNGKGTGKRNKKKKTRKSKSQRKSITGKGRRKSKIKQKSKKLSAKKKKKNGNRKSKNSKGQKSRKSKKKKTKKQGKKKGKKSKANKGKRSKKNKIKRKKNKTRKRKSKIKQKSKKSSAKKKKKNGNRKSKKSKGQKSRKSKKKKTDSCQSLDCLNNLVQTLKVEKDTVRNFLAQRKRVKNKLQLMKNKQDKKGDRWGTAMFLEKRLGETKDHKGNNSNGPLCKGVYNSKMGKMASDVAHTLEDCNATIEEACKNHIEVNKTELDEMDACEKDYREYKAESELCQNKTNDCSCWNDLAKKIKRIQDCNTGVGSAKKAEQSIKKDYAKCKNVFINCSKMEDDAIEYMIQCYTSASQIKKNIKELITIKDAATKLKKNQEAVVSSSQSKNSAKEAG